MLQMLGMMLAVQAITAIAANWLGLFAARRYAPQSPQQIARRSHYFVGAILFSLFIVYGSLVPCNYQPLELEDAIRSFREIRYRPIFLGQQRADIVASTLFWLPAGFLWMGGLTADERSPLIRLFVAVLVGFAGELGAVGVEFLQQWFPPRTISQNDILASSGGALIGVIVWLLVGELFTHGLRSFAHAPGSLTRGNLLLWAYAIGLVVYWLVPMDFVLSEAELDLKYRQGRIDIWPFLSVRRGLMSWSTVLINFAFWIPIGMLASRREHAGIAHRSMRLVAALCLAAAVEAARLFVFTRYSGTTNLILMIGGTVTGFFLTARSVLLLGKFHHTHASAILRSRSWPWVVVALAYSAVVIALSVIGHEFKTDLEWTGPRFQHFWNMPFSAMYWNSKFAALNNVLHKVAVFVPMGVLIGHSIRQLTVPMLVRRFLQLLGILAAGGVALAVEVIQIYQAEHFADVTDVLLALVGATCGMVLISSLEPDRKTSRTSSLPAFLIYGGLLAAGGFVFDWTVRQHHDWHSDVNQDLAEERDFYRPRRIPGQKPLSPAELARNKNGGVPGQGSANALPSGRHSSASQRPELFFTNQSVDPLQPPQFKQLPLPKVPGGWAIWGATGRDAQGHIWIGVSTTGGPTAPARVLEYVPESGKFLERGDVLTALRQAGRLKASGVSQMKIHSKLVLGGDGHLYFTSMDEEGEEENGGRLPRWGSHLWRLRLDNYRWEHLLAAPEGLIAVAGSNDWIYALGYFGHKLYQYHLPTGRVRSVSVGSVDGHISRNFLCDDRGHAYVPRLTRASDTGSIQTTLVEYNTDLKQVGETPLSFYLSDIPTECHGIVGVQHLADRSLVFSTHRGFLYRIAPNAEGAAQVSELGWIHPLGESYVSTLFTYTGSQHLVGIGRRTTGKDEPYEWLVFDLDSNTSHAVPLSAGAPIRSASYLYGSMTRDARGDFYIVGGGPTSPLNLSADVERAILAIGGTTDDLTALRDVAKPQHGPLVYRCEVNLAP